MNRLHRIISLFMLCCLFAEAAPGAFFPEARTPGQSLLFTDKALVSPQVEGWRPGGDVRTADVTRLVFAVSPELWPGLVLAEARQGQAHLLTLASTKALEWIKRHSKPAYDLARTGQAKELIRLILGDLGPPVETAKFLTETLTQEIETYKARHGQANGNAHKTAKKLLDPLIHELAQSHRSGVFRKGKKGEILFGPVTKDELQALEEQMKEWALPLYQLFTRFYSLPRSQRNDFQEQLKDELNKFTDRHRAHNLAVYLNPSFPVGTPYATVLSEQPESWMSWLRARGPGGKVMAWFLENVFSPGWEEPVFTGLVLLTVTSSPITAFTALVLVRDFFSTLHFRKAPSAQPSRRWGRMEQWLVPTVVALVPLALFWLSPDALSWLGSWYLGNFTIHLSARAVAITTLATYVPAILNTVFGALNHFFGTRFRKATLAAA